MSKSEFEKLLNQATNPGNIELDWDATLNLCDLLKRKDKDTIKAKDAVALIKKKILDKNNAVALNGLKVIEACMKNCGIAVHREVLDRSFLDDMHGVAKSGCPAPIKDKIVELIGIWDAVLGSEDAFKSVHEVSGVMKLQGFSFPALKDTDFNMDSEAAPDWVEDNSTKSCHMCRTAFSAFKRRHHCRNCGNVFCNQCSSKKARIPRFGFTDQEVRVCDFCHKKLSGNAPASADDELPSEYLRSSLARESQESATSRGPVNEEELKRQEEEELQMAMALSLSEEESKTSKPSTTNYYAPPASAPPPTNYYTPPAATQSVREPEPPYVPPPAPRDPDLARYEDREYWERRRSQQQEQLAHEYEMPDVIMSQQQHQLPAQVMTDSAVAGPAVGAGAVAMATALPSSPDARDVGEDNEDYRTLVSSMRNTIEMFCSRMQTVHGLGRSIALDSSVQTLFHSLNAMHAQLLKHTEDQSQLKSHYEGLQKKLQSVKEARASLNSMRRAYQKKQRQMEEEREMLARLQVQQKLELMRQQRREEEDHQEMLRQRRQKEIDQQLKIQEQLNQQRLMEHQQRQMQLHLSVQAEQQSQLGTYATSELPQPTSSYSVDPPSQYEQEPMRYVPPQAQQLSQATMPLGYQQPAFMPNQQIEPVTFQQPPPPQQQQQQPAYSTASSSVSLQPSVQQFQPQYQPQPQHLQPMESSFMTGYSPPTLRREPLPPRQEPFYGDGFQPQQAAPVLQPQPATFPVTSLQTGHQPPPHQSMKPEPQLISFD
ncbi:hepatocyte growth factor-regulated tyrosine kinase substrate-like isoform X2 [Oscarella lobularis]|uniref:hepatocyte growth factor-regulated tyrosine kinase substrate-like isoform X2 n=1 Tax=Oscarella lobularis TaxID=121494 RepID=UPI0033133FD2